MAACSETYRKLSCNSSESGARANRRRNASLTRDVSSGNSAENNCSAIPSERVTIPESLRNSSDCGAAVETVLCAQFGAIAGKSNVSSMFRGSERAELRYRLLRNSCSPTGSVWENNPSRRIRLPITALPSPSSLTGTLAPATARLILPVAVRIESRIASASRR